MTEATIRPEDIRWRVGQVSKKDVHKGSLLGYIDARTCMEALDALDPEWSAVHGDPIIVGGELMGVPCTVTVNGVRRSDVGMPSSQEPIKGAYSDALKRAAVHFGIGRELYELPRIWVTLDDYKRPVATPTLHNGRWTLPKGMGTVFYDREPESAPEQRGGKKPSSPSAAPAPRTPEQQALLDQILAVPGMTTARMSLLADAVGVQKGERATEEQLRSMVALIEQPAGEPKSPGRTGGGEASSDLPAADTPSSGEPVPDAATPSAGTVPPDTQPEVAPNDLMDDIIAITGGEDVTPEPGTLESAIARAEAKAAKAKVRA